MIITEMHIVIVYLLAGVGCMFYMATRYRRRMRAIWGTMIIPCIEIIALYTWFAISKMPIVERAQPTRIVFISVGLQIALISFTLAYRDYKNVRK